MPRWSVPAVTGTENDIDGNPIDFDARFTIAGSGVAWWLLGWATELTQESWELDCTETDPEHEHDDGCYLYNEPEEVADRSRVIAVMVGDDREHIVGTDELTEIPEDGYCLGCGQTGCHAERLDVS